MTLTDDPTDTRLGHGVGGDGMNEAYLVLSEEERAKGWQRPFRDSYTHETCGTSTAMGRALAETYARDPGFYGATYCVHCHSHFKVGEDGEFVWNEQGKPAGIKVGS